MRLLFSACDVLKIAEIVEEKALDFYESAQHLLPDAAFSRTCQELACWSNDRRDYWISRRQDLDCGTQDGLDPHGTDAGLADAGAMAGLTWFGQRPNSPTKLRGVADRGTLLQVAARRIRELIVFYQGLKAFALDRASLRTIDSIIDEERKHFEYIQQLTHHKNSRPLASPKAVA